MSKYGKDAYHFGSSFIQCILPYNILNRSKQERLLGKSDTENDTENDTEKMLINLIKENPYISKAKMSEKTGKSVPTISRALKKSQVIIHVGPAKGGHWEIKE